MRTANKITVTQQVNIVMPVWLKTDLHDAARAKGVSFSEFVKDCLKDCLKREVQSQPSKNHPAG